MSSPLREALRELTPQQRAVLKARCRGFTNRESADELYISEETVRNHLTMTYRKVERVVPNMRGRSRRGTGYALCYALGGLICDHHDRTEPRVDCPAQDDASESAPQADA